MRTEELLDGRSGCGPGGTRSRSAPLRNLHEALRRACREAVDRMRDDVGMNMLGEMEANRKTARARTLRVVVGNGRNAREVPEKPGTVTE